MTQRIVTTRRMKLGRMKLAGAACLGQLVIATAGCQDGPVSVRGTPVYAVDVNGGAKNCVTSSADVSGGKSATATMTVGNDGGWCGVTVAQSGRPFSAGLVQTRAQHGQLNVHSVGDNTRVDYIPDPGFTGADSFAVKMVPGNPVLTVNVTVAPK